MKRVKTLVVTRPISAQAPAPQRVRGHFPARVDHREGFAPLLVVIPVIGLLIVGLLIMVLSTFVKAPRSASSTYSDEDEEVRVELPVGDEIGLGETPVDLGPAFSR